MKTEFFILSKLKGELLLQVYYLVKESLSLGERWALKFKGVVLQRMKEDYLQQNE